MTKHFVSLQSMNTLHHLRHRIQICTRSWQTAPDRQKLTHQQTHCSGLGLLFGKSCYEIPPQPANTSFVRSDKTRGISYFLSLAECCVRWGPTEASAQSGFSPVTPPHTHIPYNLPPVPHTSPFPPTYLIFSQLERDMTGEAVCVCDCRVYVISFSTNMCVCVLRDSFFICHHLKIHIIQIPDVAGSNVSALVSF